MIRRSTSLSRMALITLGCALVPACTGSTQNSDLDSEVTDILTVLAYDSFLLPDDAFAEFTASTGIDVEIALGGDAGELAAKVALTAGNPEGDVVWGVDNSLLSRLEEADAFDPYVSRAVQISPALVDSGDDLVTPVDFGYVCVNYDIAALADLGLEPPRTFDDLTLPAYRGMLVVPNATTSSPGLAFVLATRVAFGDAWLDYWRRLMDNDIAIAGGWTDAYYTRFTRYGGDRPLVVSYSTSPPAEILLADPPLPPGSPALTGVLTETCFEQIEFAGVLRGTRHPEAARQLVDFLVSRPFQELLPENLFVYPANIHARIPDSFTSYAPIVSNPWRMDPQEISDRRVDLLEDWSRVTGS